MAKNELLKTIALIERAQIGMLHSRSEVLSEELFQEIYTLLDKFSDRLITEAADKGTSPSVITAIVEKAQI